MKINPVLVAKKITTAIVGFGTGSIITAIVENNTDPEKTTDKVSVKLGTWALAAMVADAASAYTDAKIDELIDAVNQARNPSDESDTEQ